MTEATLITSKDFTKGTEDPVDISVPVGATEVDVFIDRTDLSDSRIALAVQGFLSLDNGSSWKPWGGFGTIGGTMTNPDTGKTETKSGMIFTLPEPKSKIRKFRITLTVSDTAKTSLKYEFK